MARVEPDPAVRVRALTRRDLDDVMRIDALHTGTRNAAWWERAFEDAFGTRREGLRVALGAEVGPQGRLAGYLLGEVRALEFGSEPCGWVFAVGVDPEFVRLGAASALLEAACRRFLDGGIARVRTMVRRNDVPVLAFFRSNGFVAGPFAQLERDLTSAE